LLPVAGVDWDALAVTIPVAVRFLDDVIDMNAYPVKAIDTQTKLTRKIGLGVMGWADLLFKLDIPYDSEEALALADRMMAFIRHHADAASEALALERGPFPAWEASIYGPKGPQPDESSPPSPRRERGLGGEEAPPVRPLRNSTRTTVAPTGTLSIIADCTGGIEPAFALAYTRQHYLDPKNPSTPVRLTELNKIFEAVAREHGFYSDALVDHLATGGSLRDRPEVPEDVRRRFVTAHDIAPEWHVRMQAAFQRHTDNAVSKTINFPREATIADVAEAYLLAYREGCKGITIYRDGSRAGQVLSHIADGEGVPVALEPAAAIGGVAGPPSPKSERGLGGEVSSGVDGLSLAHPEPASRRRRAGDGAHRRARGYTPPRPALPFAEVATAVECPDCGNPLVFAEGCLTCRACGFTQCG
jgi:ribonucleoside-diphosphate reductase alpha chain